MRHISFYTLGIFVVLILLAGTRAQAQTLVSLHADHIAFYYDRFLIEADGNVRINMSDGTTMTGDAFSMDLKLNRFLIASHVQLRSKGGDLSGAALADFLDFNRVYFVPVTSEPDRWTYLDGDYLHPLKGREMPGDVFNFPGLGNAKPDIVSHDAVIAAKEFVRFSHPIAYVFGAGIPLPSFYVNFSSNQYLAQNSLSGASYDATWNVTGSANAISAVHLRNDPTNGTYLSFEQHFAGSHEYAVASLNPATVSKKYWNLVTGDQLGKSFLVTTFSQLYTDQSGLSQPHDAAQATYITATQAFHQSYLTAVGQFVNYNLIGPSQPAIPNHPNALQLTATTFNHRVAHLPLYEQIRYGFGFNHDAYGLQQFRGTDYTTIWNHLAGITLYTPSVKFGNRDNVYKTFFFNATFDKQRQWFTVPHFVDRATTTGSISRSFSRAFSAYTSYSVSNTGDYYRAGGYGYDVNHPAPPGIDPSLLAFRGVATFRTATLGLNYSTNPNFYAGFTFRQHRDFPVPVPGEFTPPPTNVLGAYIYNSYLGQPPYDATGEVRVRIARHFNVDVQRTYYFNFGTQRWSPQFVVQVTPQ